MEPVIRTLIGRAAFAMALAALCSGATQAQAQFQNTQTPDVPYRSDYLMQPQDMSAQAMPPGMAPNAQMQGMNPRAMPQNGLGDDPATLENSMQACLPYPFGQNIFTDPAPRSPNAIMSSKQRVAAGDRLTLAIWGAIQSEEHVQVDSQGFIYIPGVGPVQVSGQTEEQLSGHIRNEIRRVFREDVQVYARLEQNAGTPVMVTGGVAKPGQYYGSAQDSLVVWLQRAGGILPQQGSYRNIRILRSGALLRAADVYAFLQDGQTESVDWQVGDVIVVDPPMPQITATGSVRRCAVFELPNDGTSGQELITLAQPLPGTSHAIVTGHRNGQPFTRIYPLSMLAQAPLQDGDRVEFYAAPQNQQITVRVEGPIKGNSLLVVPIHTRLSEVLDLIPVNADISNTQAIFLKRQSVAAAQTEALNQSLNRLLQSVMTAPAQSDGEAMIRAAREAELVQGFVSRIKGVKPDGRVVVMQGGSLRDLPLEDNDVIVIPQKTNVVSIEGEIVLPRMVVARDGAHVADYVNMAGGYTERALKDDYIIIHPNGDAVRAKDPQIAAGDRVLVLPRVDSKNMQTTKDLVQILYQIAVGAGVLVKL